MPKDNAQRLLRDLRDLRLAQEVTSMLHATTDPFSSTKYPLFKGGNAGSLPPSLYANPELELGTVHLKAFPAVERPQKPGYVDVQNLWTSDSVIMWELSRH
jgi:hypothetical protein